VTAPSRIVGGTLMFNMYLDNTERLSSCIVKANTSALVGMRCYDVTHFPYLLTTHNLTCMHFSTREPLTP
jgi:hypothetical protein